MSGIECFSSLIDFIKRVVVWSSASVRSECFGFLIDCIKKVIAWSFAIVRLRIAAVPE